MHWIYKWRVRNDPEIPENCWTCGSDVHIGVAGFQIENRRYDWWCSKDFTHPKGTSRRWPRWLKRESPG
jgi:hypothetical protein